MLPELKRPFVGRIKFRRIARVGRIRVVEIGRKAEAEDKKRRYSC